jgi:hypothetical protein
MAKLVGLMGVALWLFAWPGSGEYICEIPCVEKRLVVHPVARDPVLEQLRELYQRTRRFEREAEGLNRDGRELEAQQHSDAAKRYREQFEKMLGVEENAVGRQ